MTNKRGDILWRIRIGTLLFFIVVPKYAHAMNAELNPDVLRKKILNSYTILNEARSQESTIAFLRRHPPKEPKFDWLRDLLSSIKKYRELTGENERFTSFEKVITQEMQEGARYMVKKDTLSENLNASFEQELENEKR